MMRTTVSTQPQIIIVACCITLRRSAYGAWGNYSVHDDKGAKITKATFIGHINPLRYRGYYYDRETRLYYLQSRYYGFTNCRFINANTFATTDANGFLSANMFAYCENNPIMRADESGEFFNTVIGAVVGATFASGFAGSIVGDVIEAKSNGQNLCTGEVIGRAIISGMANMVTGGLNVAVGKATGEVFNKTLSLKRVAKTIWRSTSDLVKRGRGITRAFGVDSTVKMTLLQRMSARIFSGRWGRK